MSAANEIQVACPTPGCGRRYRVAAQSVGKMILCKVCGQKFRVASPATSSASRSAATLTKQTEPKWAAPVADNEPAQTDQAQCPHCHKPCGILPEWRGKKLQCPSCGKQFIIPADEPVSLPQAPATDHGAAFFTEDPSSPPESPFSESDEDAQSPVTPAAGSASFWQGLFGSARTGKRRTRTIRQDSRPIGISILGWLQVISSAIGLFLVLGFLALGLIFLREYATLVLILFAPSILSLAFGFWLGRSFLDGRVWSLRFYQVINSVFYALLFFLLPAMLWQLGLAFVCGLVMVAPITALYFYHFAPRVESWFTDRTFRFESYFRSRFFAIPGGVCFGPFLVGLLLLPFGVFNNAFNDTSSPTGWADSVRQPDTNRPVAKPVNDPALGVSIKVTAVPHVEIGELITEKLRSLADSASPSFHASAVNDSITMTITPVSDPQAFAQKIDFGKTTVKGRNITIVVDRSKFAHLLKPGGGTDPVGMALLEMQSWDVHRRKRGVERVERVNPNERRAEVARGLERLLDDADQSMREVALRALGKWGGKENVSALERIANQDHRELANKARDALKEIAKRDPSVKPNIKEPTEVAKSEPRGDTGAKESGEPDPDRAKPGESPEEYIKRMSKQRDARKTPLAAWTAAPDPTQVTFEVKPPKGRDAFIPVAKSFGGDGAFYPASFSPFVAVNGAARGAGLELWNLATRKAVARITGELKVNGPWDISPDGAHLAFVSGFARRGPVEIWAFKPGQKIREVAHGREDLEALGFAGPERLVVVAMRDKRISVWKVSSGDMERELTVSTEIDRESLALSPGGKYLLLMVRDPNTVRVYDLSTGSVAGELDVPKHGNWDRDCKSLRVSNDGKWLAGLFEGFGKQSILVWDFATGKLIHEHSYREKLEHAVKNIWYHGPPLDWLPDASGWLVFGNAIIDRDSGEILLEFPEDENKQKARRMLDNDHIAAFVTVGQAKDPAVQVVPLLKDQMADARKKLPPAEAAAVASLPPESKADWSSVKQVSVVAAPVPWSVEREPINATAQRARKIDLKAKRDQVKRVQFSSVEVGQAAVDCEGSETAKSEKSIKTVQSRHCIDRFDLKNGNHVGRTEIPEETELFAFSHDATRVLLRDTDKRERVDVWSLADGKPVAGWRPYATERGEDRLVMWAAFVDSTNVLTNNKTGKLVLWSVPDCKAIWAIEQAIALYSPTPVLSPHRNYVVALGNKSIAFLDARTGEPRGELTTPSLNTGGGPQMLAASFRNDGDELAALFWGRRGNETSRWLGRWDLKSGKLLAEIPVPTGNPHRVDWCGKSHALLDGRTLVDFEHQRPIWHYTIRWGGKFADPSPDRRIWYTVGIPTVEPDNLAAVLLPEAEAIRRIRAATSPDAKVMFGPKSSVSINLASVNPPKDTDTYRKTITDSITASLKKQNITVGQNQPVTLAVEVREQGTGETIEFEEAFTPGFMNRKRFTVQVTDLVGKLSLKSGGQTMWEVEVAFGMQHVFGFLRLPPGESDPGRYLRTEQWNHFQRWVKDYPLPEQISQLPNGTFAVLPGFTELTPSGVASAEEAE